jgi:hypothetical protein
MQIKEFTVAYISEVNYPGEIPPKKQFNNINRSYYCVSAKDVSTGTWPSLVNDHSIENYS